MVQSANLGSGWKDKATYAVAIQARALVIPARPYILDNIVRSLCSDDGSDPVVSLAATVNSLVGVEDGMSLKGFATLGIEDLPYGSMCVVRDPVIAENAVVLATVMIPIRQMDDFMECFIFGAKSR